MAAQIPSVRDWSTLLPELIVSVAERLHTADIIRLRAVCRRWAWILGRVSLVPLSSSIVPWLLLPNQKGEEADYCSFLPLKSHRRDSISLFPLPELVGRRCVGSSPDGWLVTLDLALQPRILNPLTREEIPLPSLLTIALDFTPIFDSDGSVLEFVKHLRAEDFRDRFVQKIFLTFAPPASGIAVGIYGFRGTGTSIAIARPGDDCWATIPPSPDYEDFEDVVYRREDQCLYVVTSDAGVLIFHLSNISSLVPIQVIKAETLTKDWNHVIMVFPLRAKHLIFLGCDLLQIWRIYDKPNFNYEDDEYDGHFRVETIDVKVMKHQSQKSKSFDAIDNASRVWIPIRDLGDYSVFVGCNHAFAVHVNENDNDSTDDSVFGLRRNCIYFTDDDTVFGPFSKRKWHVADVGVYDLGKETIVKRFFSSDSNELCSWPPPVWFFPTRLSFNPPHL